MLVLFFAFLGLGSLPIAHAETHHHNNIDTPHHSLWTQRFPCDSVPSSSSSGEAQAMFQACKQTKMISEDKALPGRDEPLQVADKHFVLGNPMKPPFPEHLEQVVVATGCFWGMSALAAGAGVHACVYVCVCL